MRGRKEGAVLVFEKIRDLIADQLEIDPELIKPETDLMLDLNADSLDAVDVLTQIEDEFGIEIPDEKTEEFNIVANLVKYVEESIQK
ncbi:MAG: acyl carrier protein [Firmicutes bacterium]|nr:acyl carrier protein [Bacillota bacterium]MBR0481343.1 acyl carrier protein [Bacillota bacterium]